MTHDNYDGPMWEDPHESSALRQLLRAGHVENCDYDVERGLARHLAQLQAGAQLPAWAAQTTLQKSASWSLLAWLVPPAISAGVVGAWLAFQPATPAPASLSNLVPPVESAPAAALVEPTVAEATPEPEPSRPAEAKEPKRVIEEREAARDQVDTYETTNVVARNVRPAARANGARRARVRMDDAPSGNGYAAAAPTTRDNVGVGPSTPSGNGYAAVAPTTRDNVGVGPSTSSVTSPSEDVSASRPVVAPSPAAREPEPEAAPVEEAKAKAVERRAKDEEPAASAPAPAKEKEDEVSGARLEREMRMLAVAQRVLTEDPARTLRLCRQGEAEFRGSMFSAERKQLALLALVQLGKVDQARREGIPFLRAYPNAPWSARLREALRTGQVPNPDS